MFRTFWHSVEQSFGSLMICNLSEDHVDEGFTFKLKKKCCEKNYCNVAVLY